MKDVAFFPLILFKFFLHVFNCAAMGCQRGSRFTRVFFCCFRRVGHKTQTSSRQLLNQPVMFIRQKLLKHWWRILFSLLCVKYIFFCFYKSYQFEGNNKYAKKGITSAMERVDKILSFTFATWQIISCLLCKIFSAGACLLSFLSIFFLQKQ